MSITPCRDKLGCFLLAYEEYFAGKRRYEDLPPAISRCPGHPADDDPAHRIARGDP